MLGIDLAKIWDWIKRNTVWLAIGLAGLILLKPAISEFNTILTCIIMEMLALGLSGLALFVYTNIDFTKKLSAGEDGKFNSVEQHAFAKVIGLIFLGVHILVGLVFFGTYFVQFG